MLNTYYVFYQFYHTKVCMQTKSNKDICNIYLCFQFLYIDILSLLSLLVLGRIVLCLRTQHIYIKTVFATATDPVLSYCAPLANLKLAQFFS